MSQVFSCSYQIRPRGEHGTLFLVYEGIPRACVLAAGVSLEVVVVDERGSEGDGEDTWDQAPPRTLPPPSGISQNLGSTGRIN